MAVAKKTDPKPEAEAKEPAPVDTTKMPVRLFNVLMHWDFYILAKDETDAREGAIAVIRAGQQLPYEQVAYEARRERDIRTKWRDEPPWMSATIPDQPEETTLEAFTRLYTKR